MGMKKSDAGRDEKLIIKTVQLHIINIIHTVPFLCTKKCHEEMVCTYYFFVQK